MFTKLDIGQPLRLLTLNAEQAAGALALLLSRSGFDVESPEYDKESCLIRIQFSSWTYDHETDGRRWFTFSIGAADNSFYGEQDIEEMFDKIKRDTLKVGVVCFARKLKRDYGEH